MPKTFFTTCLVLVLCLCAVVTSGQPARAAAPSGLTVNPSLKEIVISPTQNERVFPIYVTNNTKADITLLVSVVDFGALDESGGVAFLGDKGNLERKYGLAGWSAVDKPSITLKPKQSEELNVTITNRPTFALGGHYGAVLFKLAAPGTTEKKVTLNQVFSSLIFVKKSGGDIYDLSLNSIERDNNLTSLPSSIKLRFHNAGNVHVAPGGTVRVLDPLGREVATGRINPEAGRVLPENARIFPVKLEPKNVAWLPGPYRLDIRYNFNEQNHFVTHQSSFLYVSSISVAVVVGVCALGLYILRIRRKNAKKSTPPKVRTSKKIKVKFD